MPQSKELFQWWIGAGGGRNWRARNPPVQFIIFMQLLAKNIPSNKLAPLFWGWYLLTEMPLYFNA